jgi:integrase
MQTYLESWLVAKEAAGRKPSTMSQYREATRRFLVPCLGNIKLSELRASHIEEMLSSMESDGRGVVTQRRTVAVLSSALGTAVKKRLVTWNVCQQLELPPVNAEVRPVWDARQVREFLDDAEVDRFAALWRIYALLGLRRGEALALSWDVVNLETGTLRVQRTLGEVGGQLVWGAPKTANGSRTVALDPATVTALRSHRSRQSAEKLALGGAYDDQGLVFAMENGRAIWPGSISDRFHRLSEVSGLPRIRLHDLRGSADRDTSW